MTKRDLVKWLEKEKITALATAKERKEKMIEQAAEAEYAAIDLNKFMKEMRESYEDIVSHFDELAERSKSRKGIAVSKFHWKISCSEYSWFVEDPSHLATTVKDLIRIDTEDYQAARRQAISYYNNVEKTYDDVIQTVKNLSSAKDGLEYLAKLGFNTSKILPLEEKKQLPATISVNVDTKYLIFDKD